MLGGGRAAVERRPTAAQQALLALRRLEARGRFLVVNLLLLLLVLYTSHRFPHKFLRVRGDCDSNWMRADAAIEDHEVVCCGDTGGGPPCYAGMDLVPVLTSMQGAWAIPLSGLVFNYIGVILGPDPSMDRIRVCVRRGLLYAAVMAFRTVVLYMWLGALERKIVGAFAWLSPQEACWFADMRSSGRCPQAFDHSDHIVLLVAHYMAIPLFEWFALTTEGPGVKRTLIGAWLAFVALVATYLLFFTASFFHSPMENLVGLLVAQTAVMLPLYLLTQDRLATLTGASWLRLKHFVLPPAVDKEM